MEYVKIANNIYSKIICGTNPFYGNSHFSKSRDSEYIKRFNDNEILNVISTCIEKGINTLETSANKRIFSLFLELKKRKPNQLLNFIGSTRIDKTSDVKRHQNKLEMLINFKSSICIIHSQFIDRGLKNNKINGIELLLDKIHQNNLLAGISTHSNNIIELCEKNKYPIDVYMFPLNILGFTYPGYKGNETPNERIKIIKNTEKPFIIMKTLAAGRVPPLEALEFVYKNIKENDLISIGFGSSDEVLETIGIIDSIENNQSVI